MGNIGFGRLLFVMSLLFSIAVGEVWANSNQARENEIKVVLLERFTRFISWPAGTPAEEGPNPFTICVFGESSLTPVLEAAYRDRLILDREVRIVVCENTDILPACNLLFLAHSQDSELPRICEAALNAGALTVADSPGFGHRGVMINFYRDDDRIRFEINESAVHSAGFSMSYHLLKEARILRPRGGTP